MKILLIYPPREHYIVGVTPHVHVEADSGYYPPIGLLYIAAYLEENTSCEVHVLDAHTERMDHAQVKSWVAIHKPDVVGIYMSTYYLYDGVLLAKNVKAVSPAITVIAGGPHTALYPRETINLPEVDCVMVGEAEESFKVFTQLWNTPRAEEIELLNNVLTKRSRPDKIPYRGRMENLDALPFPARHLLDTTKYSSILARNNPITTIITSRGCPFNCYFCSNLESGQKVRYRSARNVVDEIEHVVKYYGIRDLLFFDELFTSNRQRTLDICDEIIKRGIKVRWHCRSRADVLDRELVQAMKRAGCRLIQFGIETGSPRLQGVINKKLNLDRVAETVEMVHDEGIYTFADLMFGLPGETDEESQQTLDYALSLKLDYAVFGMFHPIPGSVFYDRAMKENLFPDYWRELVNHPETQITDHSWTQKDRIKYERIMSHAYNAFYFRFSYMFRRLLRTDSFEQLLWQARSAFKIFPKLLGMARK